MTCEYSFHVFFIRSCRSDNDFILMNEYDENSNNKYSNSKNHIKTWI